MALYGYFSAQTSGKHLRALQERLRNSRMDQNAINAAYAKLTPLSDAIRDASISLPRYEAQGHPDLLKLEQEYAAKVDAGFAEAEKFVQECERDPRGKSGELFRNPLTVPERAKDPHFQMFPAPKPVDYAPLFALIDRVEVAGGRFFTHARTTQGVNGGVTTLHDLHLQGRDALPAELLDEVRACRRPDLTSAVLQRTKV